MTLQDPVTLLLAGGGRYTADVVPADAAHVTFVRSDHAHALIRSIDTEDARSAEGVIAVRISDR